MKRPSFSILIFLNLFVMGLGNAWAKKYDAMPGEFLVKLRTPIQNEQNFIHQKSIELQSYIKTVLPEANIIVVKRPVMEIESYAMDFLKSQEDVEYVEPNFIYRINKVPNDPLFGQLWGLNNLGEKDSGGTVGISGVDISALRAWDVETGSKDVVVAVVDTGVLYDSPDLKENAWVNEAESAGIPGVDDDKNGVVDDIHGFNAIKNSGDPKDDHGHGSHCAATIGAHGDDGFGLVGVNWNVRIMGIKFLSSQGSGTSEDAIKGIDYATKMGAQIMSNSWGGGPFSQALYDSIKRAEAKGVLFLAAAGNESNNNDKTPSYPASYDIPNVLSVAAVNNRGEVASFSNYGKKSVHVGAPGVNILSLTTGGYKSWSGTSMATPHVSGVAALVAAHFPGISYLEIKQRIMETARPFAMLKNRVVSGGLANAYGALTNSRPEPDQNDPSNWQTVSQEIQSPHPYSVNFASEHRVEVPGANEIAIYFEKLETESGYDFIYIEDEKGNVLQKISGDYSDSFSTVIKGSSAKINFRADDSNQGYGFLISKIAYR